MQFAVILQCVMALEIINEQFPTLDPCLKALIECQNFPYNSQTIINKVLSNLQKFGQLAVENVFHSLRSASTDFRSDLEYFLEIFSQITTVPCNSRRSCTCKHADRQKVDALADISRLILENVFHKTEEIDLLLIA